MTEASEPEAASSQGEEPSGYSSSERMLLKRYKKNIVIKILLWKSLILGKLSDETTEQEKENVSVPKEEEPGDVIKEI